MAKRPSSAKSVTIKCRDCGDEFDMFPNKPGFINQCSDCASRMHAMGDDVEKLGGNMVYSHKTAPEIEIKPMAQALIFAKKQRRLGHGVIGCIVESKLTNQTRESSKQGSGTEDRAVYYSNVGEKRSVKQ